MQKNDFKTFNLLILLIVLLGLASALKSVHTSPLSLEKKEEPKVTPASSSGKPPEFVLVSFDGSKSIDIWRDLREFKDEMRASSTPINFTYFINAAYFLTQDTKTVYQGPGRPAGSDDIGFSEDLSHVRSRITEINLAIANGDEIASHSVGHLNGTNWSKDDWTQEFTSFNKIITSLDTIYPTANLPKLNLKPSDIIGFRAPYLGVSAGLPQALDALHFRYNTSEKGDAHAWPTRDINGLWTIPLGTVILGADKEPVIAMDYNLYMRETNTKDTLKKGTPEWTTAYNDTLKAFTDYFNTNYTTNRAPVLVGYHFESWNDGVYWEAMKTFARQVCGKPEVRCGTFRDLVNYLDTNGVPRN